MAKIFNVSSKHVTVTVSGARHPLHAAIAVDYEIAVTDVDAAAKVQARIKAVNPAVLMVGLKAAGLSEVGPARYSPPRRLPYRSTSFLE